MKTLTRSKLKNQKHAEAKPRACWLLYVCIALISSSLLNFDSLRAETILETPLDYSDLSHKLSIELLRSGNHNPTGTNQYSFQANMYGLLNSSEERNLSFDKRKKNTIDLGRFGDTTLDALSAWKPDEKAKETKDLKIEGNQIRELVAKTMTDFKVKETDVAVMVELILIEKSKRYFVLPDEHEVIKASYYPIAPTKFDTPFRTNIPLTMTDDKGTQVRIAVTYDNPILAPKNKPTAVPATNQSEKDMKADTPTKP